MSEPEVQALGGLYLYKWKQEQVSARVDRIYQSSHHDVHAEVRVDSINPESPGYLSLARLNLTSTQSKNGLAKHLATRTNGHGRADAQNPDGPIISWPDIVEQLSVMTLEAHRKGESIVEIADMEMPTAAEYRLYRYLQEGQAAVAFGDGESGKSYLSEYWAVLIAAGIDQGDLRAVKGNVLILDWETDNDTTWDRLNRISAGLGIAIPDGIFYRRCYATLPSDIEQIQQYVLEHDIQLVIVDSAAPACGEPQADQATIEYFRALRSLKVTTLTIAHVSKTGKEHEIFGSVYWRNMPRSNLRINSNHEPGSSEFTVGIKHTKGNNEGRLQDSGFKLVFGTDDVRFSSADQASLMAIPEIAKGLPVVARMRIALARGAMTIPELAQEVDATEAVVRTTLRRWLRKPNGFIQPAPHTWGLSTEI